MEYRILDIELKSFSETNKQTLADILLDMSGGDNKYQSVFDINRAVAGLVDAFEMHKVEHGIGVGCLQDGNGTILGIGGFHYLAETGLYEVICNMVPQHEEKTLYALEFLVHEAFSNLRMDKVCSRALLGSAMDNSLRANGFVYAGERAFISEDREQIWNYYELEDETNMVVSAGHYALGESDWDAIF